MAYVIRFSDRIKKIMIKHTFKDPTKECGGFLYGNMSKQGDDTYFDINGIYREEGIRGTSCTFNFGFSYICRAVGALRLDKFKNYKLVGTYHSHGQYPAELSSVDRDDLQQYFGANKVTIVYSPKYSQLVGEVLGTDGISHRAKIKTK